MSECIDCGGYLPEGHQDTFCGAECREAYEAKYCRGTLPCYYCKKPVPLSELGVEDKYQVEEPPQCKECS